MFKKLILFVCVTISLTSCKKDEPCKANNEAYIVANNSTTDPYNIFIDGVYKLQVAGGAKSGRITVSPGTYTFRAVQASGFTVFPTVYQNSTGGIGQCIEWTGTF
jgi:hypothetical protein